MLHLCALLLQKLHLMLLVRQGLLKVLQLQGENDIVLQHLMLVACRGVSVCVTQSSSRKGHMSLCCSTSC